MKSITTNRWVRMSILASLSIFAITGCGSNSSNWGIDHPQATSVPHGPLDPNTGLYRCTIDDAALIPAGSEVKPLSEGTQLRVWHYQNSDEYACVLKGEATFKPTDQGGK